MTGENTYNNVLREKQGEITCDFCNEPAEKLRREVLRRGYDRISGNEESKSACPPCSELKMYSPINSSYNDLQSRLSEGKQVDDYDLLTLHEGILHLELVLKNFDNNKYSSERLSAVNVTENMIQELYGNLLDLKKKVMAKR